MFLWPFQPQKQEKLQIFRPQIPASWHHMKGRQKVVYLKLGMDQIFLQDFFDMCFDSMYIILLPYGVIYFITQWSIYECKLNVDSTNQKHALGEDRTYSLQIMRLMHCLLHYKGFCELVCQTWPGTDQLPQHKT